MKPEGHILRQHEVLKSLSVLPRMMVLLKEKENLPEFVLHVLSHPHCFNLKKAAYFIDNPPFGFIQGVTGVCQDEFAMDIDSLLNDPDTFCKLVQASEFNNKVRSIEKASQKKKDVPTQALIQELADMLGISSPSACTWDMRFDNYGLLIYEKAAFDDTAADEYLVNGVNILSFCPVC